MIIIDTPAGTIPVDGDGYPIYPDGLPYEYDNIVRFDLKRLEQLCNANHIVMGHKLDIITVGYWTRNEYIHPIEEYTEGGTFTMMWKGRVEDELVEFEL